MILKLSLIIINYLVLTFLVVIMIDHYKSGYNIYSWASLYHVLCFSWLFIRGIFWLITNISNVVWTASSYYFLYWMPTPLQFGSFMILPLYFAQVLYPTYWKSYWAFLRPLYICLILGIILFQAIWIILAVFDVNEYQEVDYIIPTKEFHQEFSGNVFRCINVVCFFFLTIIQAGYAIQLHYLDRHRYETFLIASPEIVSFMNGFLVISFLSRSILHLLAFNNIYVLSDVPLQGTGDIPAVNFLVFLIWDYIPTIMLLSILTSQSLGSKNSTRGNRTTERSQQYRKIDERSIYRSPFDVENSSLMDRLKSAKFPDYGLIYFDPLVESEEEDEDDYHDINTLAMKLNSKDRGVLINTLPVQNFAEKFEPPMDLLRGDSCFSESDPQRYWRAATSPAEHVSHNLLGVGSSTMSGSEGSSHRFSSTQIPKIESKECLQSQIELSQQGSLRSLEKGTILLSHFRRQRSRGSSIGSDFSEPDSLMTSHHGNGIQYHHSIGTSRGSSGVGNMRKSSLKHSGSKSFHFDAQNVESPVSKRDSMNQQLRFEINKTDTNDAINDNTEETKEKSSMVSKIKENSPQNKTFFPDSLQIQESDHLYQSNNTNNNNGYNNGNNTIYHQTQQDEDRNKVQDHQHLNQDSYPLSSFQTTHDQYSLEPSYQQPTFHQNPQNFQPPEQEQEYELQVEPNTTPPLLNNTPGKPKTSPHKTMENDFLKHQIREELEIAAASPVGVAAGTHRLTTSLTNEAQYSGINTADDSGALTLSANPGVYRPPPGPGPIAPRPRRPRPVAVTTIPSPSTELGNTAALVINSSPVPTVSSQQINQQPTSSFQAQSNQRPTFNRSPGAEVMRRTVVSRPGITLIDPSYLTSETFDSGGGSVGSWEASVLHSTPDRQEAAREANRFRGTDHQWGNS